jgi:hypothetical protein
MQNLNNNNNNNIIQGKKIICVLISQKVLLPKLKVYKIWTTILHDPFYILLYKLKPTFPFTVAELLL